MHCNKHQQICLLEQKAKTHTTYIISIYLLPINLVYSDFALFNEHFIVQLDHKQFLSKGREYIPHNENFAFLKLN